MVSKNTTEVDGLELCLHWNTPLVVGLLCDSHMCPPHMGKPGAHGDEHLGRFLWLSVLDKQISSFNVPLIRLV